VYFVPEQFESSFLKFARANEHLEVLNREIQNFFKARPYDLDAKLESDGCEFIHSVRLIEPPPKRLSVIIGDCVHNFRSALDSLAWELSSKPADQRARHRISFPIYANPADRGKVDDCDIVHPDARAVMHTLQPYSALYYLPGILPLHPLRVLQNLSNRDKHREINLVGLAFQHLSIKASEPPIERSERLGPFDDGAEITRIRFAHRDVQVEFKFSFNVTMELTELDRAAIVSPTLADISDFINNVVFPELCRPEFFQHQWHSKDMG
jgi:hypothetical protein